MAFEKVTLPPIEREGRQRVTLDEKEGKQLLDTLVKDASTENPWSTDTKDYNTRAAAQARVLFFRNELHRLFPDKVQVPKQIRSRVISADSVGGTKGKYRFALAYREANEVPDFDAELAKTNGKS